MREKRQYIEEKEKNVKLLNEEIETLESIIEEKDHTINSLKGEE